MKKIMVFALCVFCSFVITLPSFAIELTVEAVENVPSSYAKVVKEKDEEKVVFGKSGIVFGAESLNKILNAYGVSLSADAVENVPSSYAKVVKEKDEEKVVFGKSGIVFGPESLNKILNAYK